MKGWGRRNTGALVALAILLPVTAIVTGYNEWNNYYSHRPTQPVVVAAGGSAELGVARWGSATLETIAPTDPRAEAVPADARLLVAQIDVDMTSVVPECTSPLLREAGGAERTWVNARDRLTSWVPTGELLAYCSTEATGDYSLEVPFVVPDDASGPFTLDLQVVGAEPRFLRFELGG